MSHFSLKGQCSQLYGPSLPFAILCQTSEIYYPEGKPSPCFSKFSVLKIQ